MVKAILLFIILILSNNVYANFGSTKITEADKACLAENLYHEAKGESYQGILAVANVTINRTRSKEFPKSICGVVKQKSFKGCQFSWVCASKKVTDQKKYREMYRISDLILTGRIPLNLISSDVYWFHNKHVNPYWTKYGVFAGRIGAHLFYRRVKRH